jgi:hypothetical protein
MNLNIQPACQFVYFEKVGIVRKVRESQISGGTGFMNKETLF